MASVDAVGHVVNDGVRVYHFNIVFDSENWIVTKSYDDFVNLKREMEEVYSLDQIPYLTGEVRPWAKNSEKTADSRLPKLEVFLMELLVTRFQPDIFDVRIPFSSQNVKDYRLSKFAFEFLEFASHCKPHASPARKQQQQSTEVDRAVSAPNSSLLMTTAPTASAPKEKTPEELEKLEQERLEKEREAEIKRLLQKQKASVAAIAKSSEAQGRSLITDQLKVLIPSFEIFEKDRVDYVVTVELWDRTWSVNKRYSDFVNLYNELVEIYGGADANTSGSGASTTTGDAQKRINVFKLNDQPSAPPKSRMLSLAPVGGFMKDFDNLLSDAANMVVGNGGPLGLGSAKKCIVPSIEASKAPFYKKLDPDTAKQRQVFFQNYLQNLVEIVDSWEPKGLVATFHVQAAEGEGGVEGLYPSSASPSSPQTQQQQQRKIVNVAVSVNKVIFDFLNFQEHMSTINAYVARKVIEKQAEKLPEDVRLAMAEKLEAERRLKVIAELQHRQRTRKPISDEIISELLELLPLLQEDRDVINSIRYITDFGKICRDLRELDEVYGINAVGGMNKNNSSNDAATAGSGRGGGTSADFYGIDAGPVNPFFARGAIGAPSADTHTASQKKDAATNSKHTSNANSNSANANTINKPSTGTQGPPPSAIGRTQRSSTMNRGQGGFAGLQGIGTRRLAGTSAGGDGKATGGGGVVSHDGQSKASFDAYDYGSSVHEKDSAADADVFEEEDDEWAEVVVHHNGSAAEQHQSRSTATLRQSVNISSSTAGGGNKGSEQRGNAAGQGSSADTCSTTNANNTKGGNGKGSTTSSAPPAKIGLTSAQAARIAEAIYFNDTRKGGIKAMAFAMIDDRHWDALFGTLIYEWDESRSEVEEVLVKAHTDRDRNLAI